MSQRATVEIAREELKFSSGHFTIFSKTRRENIHGHNFNVEGAFTAEYDENGMAFDYGILKDKLRNLCGKLNNYFLVPQHSKYLKISKENDSVVLEFNKEKMMFPKRDIIFLPITNITVEELSQWFIQQLVSDKKMLEECNINEITIKVFTLPGQSGATTWRKESE